MMGNAIPAADELWQGIGGHFDTLGQVLCEFVDNSISNIFGNRIMNRSILINIDEVEDGFRVQLEDNGTGIEDFDPVLKLGDKSKRSTHLNEHGFGLKHALATANPENNAWKIYTRTEDETLNYRMVKAPYRFDYQEEIIENSNRNWPGKFNGSGTVIEFVCSKFLFFTLRKGISSNAGVARCLDYLKEELGYVYSGLLQESLINITISSNTENYYEIVKSVLPNWVDYYQKPKPGSKEKDLGGGTVEIEYKFGEITDSGYTRYYKRNMSSSGVEIRINGRLLMSNIFKDIWGRENHPTYNHFLAIINIKSDNRDALPKTRTSKNGIRLGDEKLENLFQWIRNVHPEPPRELTNAVSERELVKKLSEEKERHTRSDDKVVETEFKVFNKINSPVYADLYFFDGNETVIYEAKKDKADIQNVYQLLMYWDGAVKDGLKPTEGLLIASEFSEGVDIMIGELNTKVDNDGNPYRFRKVTWKDEGVKYPGN